MLFWADHLHLLKFGSKKLALSIFALLQQHKYISAYPKFVPVCCVILRSFVLSQCFIWSWFTRLSYCWSPHCYKCKKSPRSMKESNLGQLKKYSKIFLLSNAWKNKLLPQYPIRKFDVFFSIVVSLFIEHCKKKSIPVIPNEQSQCIFFNCLRIFKKNLIGWLSSYFLFIM